VTTRLVAPELRLAHSPRLQLTTFYQYNDAARQGTVNARLSWEYRPLSFLYVVLNDTRGITTHGVSDTISPSWGCGCGCATATAPVRAVAAMTSTTLHWSRPPVRWEWPIPRPSQPQLGSAIAIARMEDWPR